MERPERHAIVGHQGFAGFIDRSYLCGLRGYGKQNGAEDAALPHGFFKARKRAVGICHGFRRVLLESVNGALR